MAGQSPNFDWSIVSMLLNPSSNIPGDVKFQVIDRTGHVAAILEAHKIILALHSDHFKNVFFGSGVFFKEQEEGIVVIKDTTKEAFEDFLGFNYEKRIEFEMKTLPELYELLNLAERYQVREMKDKVVNLIKSFSISIDNITEVSATTYHFPQFKEESQALYANCLSFLGTQLSDVQSVLTFVSSCQDEATVVRLLKDLYVEDKKCTNCQQKPCKKRTDVLRGDLLLPGMLIKTKSNDEWREKYRGQLCKVVCNSGSRVSVRWENPPSPQDDDVSDPYNIHIFNMFQYACDK